MTPRWCDRYHSWVDVLRTRAARWITAGLGALLVGLAGAAPGAAQSSALVLADQPVIVIQLTGTANVLTVRSWDRPFLQVDDPDGTANVSRGASNWGGAAHPLTLRLGPFPYFERQGIQVVGNGLLPPEDFPLAGFRPGLHDAVRIVAAGGAHLTVVVPAGTGILEVNVKGGRTEIDGYHGANLFVLQQQGQVHVRSTTTTAYLQQQSGTIDLTNDAFTRIRVRDNAARLFFDHCRTTQIEATTVSGPIVYDDGSFEPGLARFESQHGSIALGVDENAQVVAHTQSGKVYAQFDGPTPMQQHSDGDATATIGGGGTLVSAITESGNVYLYDGAFGDHRNLGPQWRPVHQFFNRLAPPRPPEFFAAPRPGRMPPPMRTRRHASASHHLTVRTFAPARRRV